MSATAVKSFGADLKPNGRTMSMYNSPSHCIYLKGACPVGELEFFCMHVLYQHLLRVPLSRASGYGQLLHLPLDIVMSITLSEYHH